MAIVPDLEEYIKFFNTVELPEKLRLDSGSVCHNLPSLIENHLNVLREKGNLPVYFPYWQRLDDIKRLLLEDSATVAKKY